MEKSWKSPDRRLKGLVDKYDSMMGMLNLIWETYWLNYTQQGLEEKESICFNQSQFFIVFISFFNPQGGQI